jgi:hypothetical protein
VVDNIAEGIELLYLVRDHQKVKAIRLSRPTESASQVGTQIPFAAIPADASWLSHPA